MEMLEPFLQLRASAKLGINGSGKLWYRFIFVA